MNYENEGERARGNEWKKDLENIVREKGEVKTIGEKQLKVDELRRME